VLIASIRRRVRRVARAPGGAKARVAYAAPTGQANRKRWWYLLIHVPW